MRQLLACVLFLAACNQAEPPPQSTLPAPVVAGPTTWFICDGVDARSVFVFERDGEVIRFSEYDKPNGAVVAREDYTLGDPEGAAGSIYTPLLLAGADAGTIRETNPNMLETPAAAYTPRIAEVRLGERAVACRWLPRTRVFGITGRRTFVVHEDIDGDLIYTTYDFAAPAAPAIELSENGVSTAFSAEVRAGEEMVRPDGAEFRFQGAEGYAYTLTLDRNGAGSLAVTRNGAPVQSEDVIAFQLGDAAGL